MPKSDSPLRSASDYSVFGLHVRSDLALPELLPAATADEPDVRIRLGTIAAGRDLGVGAHPFAEGTLLRIGGVARYWVTGGSEILVEPEPGAHEQNVRLYLLGSVTGLLLHQRGLLPLHSNAVEIDGRAVAFMGRSGEGKSTLAAWFHDRGYRIIADDVCVVRFDRQGRAFATPGLRRLRLWKEILEATGRQPSHYRRSYAGADDWEKYDVPLTLESGVTVETELAAVYQLGPQDEFGVARLTGAEAADAVFANTYRGRYVSLAGSVRSHWEACLGLVTRTPMFVISRSWDLSRFDEEAAAIAAHATKVVREARNAG